MEKSSFLAYGAAESDYRAERWEGFREDYRFTGKEEDVGVGLVYFGKRFLSPALGRWVSPDPLGVHKLGQADWNLYAYVSGQLLKNIDPLGLDPQGGASSGPSGGSEGASSVADNPEYARGAAFGHYQYALDQAYRAARNDIESRLYQQTGGSEGAPSVDPEFKSQAEFDAWKDIAKRILCEEYWAARVDASTLSDDAYRGYKDAMAGEAITAEAKAVASIAVDLWVLKGLVGTRAAQAARSAIGGAARGAIGPGGFLARIQAKLAAARAARITTILREHVDRAVTKFAERGFTRRQSERLATNPQLEAAFKGERIDTFFKEYVHADPRLEHLTVTPRFKRGPDVFDPATKTWWDVTTQSQWGAHVMKYQKEFGTGIPLTYGGP